jgi:transcriptional regulator with XRE-family HTH domain
MPSLPNYLQTHRKRTSFSQEEVAFLLGIQGIDRANKVLRDERFARIPALETAIAYELIYGKPASDLFAGMYEKIAREITARSKILRHRKTVISDPKKSQAMADLALRCSTLANN